MLRRLLQLLCLAMLSVQAVPAGADTLLIEGVRSEKATASERPASGMTMDQVVAGWGEPRERHAAVGDPPITRWDYDGFAVYFEYSRVIHAVPVR